DLGFAEVADPEVSIIVLARDGLGRLLPCLASIAAGAGRTGFEVRVVADTAHDPALRALERVPGLRLHVCPSAAGVDAARHVATAQARGRYLCFLDGDTEVADGWLDAMHALFARFPDCGLVGAKLLFPDGRLREAGGILWRDGSTCRHGCFDDPWRDGYGYVRRVDFVSGAAMLVPRALFTQVAGSAEPCSASDDVRDADLAMRVRAAGRQVMFQPDARVVRHSVADARDPGAEAVDRRRLRERWHAVLDATHFERGDDVFLARERHPGKRMLVVDMGLPTPDRDAGSATMRDFLGVFLDAGLDVKFWPRNLSGEQPYLGALQQAGIEVFHGNEHVGRLGRWLAREGRHLDCVLLSRPVLAKEVLPLLRRHCPRARVLYYGHDLHHLRHRGEARVTGDALQAREAEALHRIERAVWEGVDAIYYPSASEVALVRAELPAAKVRLVPPYVFEPDNAAPSSRGRAGLLFVAGFSHPPNIDAARWFAAQVLPGLRRAHPDLRVTFAGASPSADVLALRECGIEVSGSVDPETLEALYAQARVAVVPLRFGAGVKRKTVEAMHHGVPLVTTTTGLEGLAGAEDAVAVADDAQAFQEAVLALLCDDDLWRRRAAAAQAFVRARFSRDAMAAA
ncbi:MAG: glycosyltransferase, partial [Luteimonas sp.]|nr:glycosyltransferase [Luteimonas sp.]